MFDPPPGFDDLLSDAADWPITGKFQERTVPRVGVVIARKCKPRAAAALAMSANRHLTPTQRLNYLTCFIIDHLGEGEYERLLLGTMTNELVGDAMQRTARAVATWGTARPYTAVITLSVFAGHNWRTLRESLATAGISNPMGLPSLHAVLDITEKIVVDSLFQSGERDDGPPSEGEKKVRRFYDSIYAPDLTDVVEMNGEEYMPTPAGFENPETVEADFDAFMRTPG